MFAGMTLAPDIEHADPSAVDCFDVESVLPAVEPAIAEKPAVESSPTSDRTDINTDQGPVRLRAGRERAFARRIAAKALEISAATETDRAMLAGLLGCDADVVTLTVEVMNAPRGAATRAVADLDHVAAADPMEAPIRVATLTRERQRALWNLLTKLGVVSTGPPQNEFKRALATAKAVFAVDTDTCKRLAGAVALARRW
jgi:hypothetical protein